MVIYSLKSVNVVAPEDMLADTREAEQVASWILMLDETLAWHESKVLDGFSLRRRAGGWLLCVNARNAAGTPLVCLTWGSTRKACVKEFAFAVVKGHTDWRPDKYALDN